MIRAATIADAPAITDVINRAYAIAEAHFVNDDRITQADVERRLQTPDAGFFVSDEDGVVACIYWEVRGREGYFGLLAVDPDAQKRGYARKLIEYVEAHCRVAGCNELTLDIVNLREELPAFYEYLGFRQTGTAEFREQQKLTQPAHLIIYKKPL